MAASLIVTIVRKGWGSTVLDAAIFLAQSADQSRWYGASTIVSAPVAGNRI